MTFRKTFENQKRARQVARAINYAQGKALAIGAVVVIEYNPKDTQSLMGLYLRNWERVTK